MGFCGLEDIKQARLGGRRLLLAREAWMAQAAAVIPGHLRVRHGEDVMVLPAARGVRADHVRHPRFMRDDHGGVLRDDHIHFERRHAHLQGAREGADRVLRQEASRATVALEVEEGIRLRGGATQDAEEEKDAVHTAFVS